MLADGRIISVVPLNMWAISSTRLFRPVGRYGCWYPPRGLPCKLCSACCPSRDLGQMGDADDLSVECPHFLHDMRHLLGDVPGDTGIYFVEMMVGSLTALEIMAFSESMTRAISPPMPLGR